MSWVYYILLSCLAMPIVVYIAFRLLVMYVVFKVASKGATEYANARYEEIPEPIGSERWKNLVATWEAEMQSLGYERLLYYHNAYFASLGRPNFTCVYVSPDRLMAVSHYCSLWPKVCVVGNDEGAEVTELTESTGREVISVTCHSWFPADKAGTAPYRWVVSDEEDENPQDALASILPPPYVKYRWARGLTVEQCVEWHRRLITNVEPWASATPLPYNSAEEYLAQTREGHKYLSGDLTRKRWSFLNPLK